jgi:Tfp pilus assembly protein PilF
MRLSPSSTASLVCGFLLLAIAIVFGQTVGYDFVNFDDNAYVYENPQVTQGLTSASVAWAMTTSHATNWHPLTWFSHILDCQFYGLWAGGHHLTSVVLHAATAILLFLVLWRMTGDLWPSAFVAAVFAIHPLRVESVAWVAERKDVLSGLFFMLTLGAYVHYVRRPFSWVRYLMVVVLFALGLMAKPTLVTLPFVLLLLDYWPLGRMTAPLAEQVTPAAKTRKKSRISTDIGVASPQRFSIPRRVIAEKILLLLLTAYSCLITSVVQVEAMERSSFSTRAANSVVCYAAYLGQFVWPMDLAVLYPHPGEHLPIWKVVPALMVLGAISAGTLVYWRRIPALLVGWLWYLGMLVPMIGLVQVGQHAMADRYTYLPQIGLCIAVAWGAKYAAGSWRYRRQVFGVTSALIVVALMGCAWHQTTFWRDSQTLWLRALACTSDNCTAHNNLAMDLQNRGDNDAAIRHCEEALAINPDYAEAHNNLGISLQRRGENDAAIEHFAKAIAIKPDFAAAYNNMGTGLFTQGRLAEAETSYRSALELTPECVEAHANLGFVFEREGKIDAAVQEFQTGLFLAEQQNRGNLVDAMAARLRLHQSQPPAGERK